MLNNHKEEKAEERRVLTISNEEKTKYNEITKSMQKKRTPMKKKGNSSLSLNEKKKRTNAATHLISKK